MKSTRRILTLWLAAALGLAFAADGAFAHGMGGGGRPGGGFRAGPVVRVAPAYHPMPGPIYRPSPYRPYVWGVGVYGAYPWYPPYGTYYGSYYPPAVVGVPVQPPTYIEQSYPPAQASGAAPADGYWYWCPDSRTYYPYVQTCASPWQQVVPQPPAAEVEPAVPAQPAVPAVPKQ